MQFAIGDIVTLKTTGEKAIVVWKDGSCYEIKRASVSDVGVITHVTDKVWEFELETIAAHRDRLLAEGIAQARTELALNKAISQMRQEDAQVPLANAKQILN